jgi:putative ABC transport system permease protein
VGLALAAGRALSSMLFELSPGDPTTLIAVSILLGAIALLASYLPARRATRIDPVVALRAE